MKKLLTVLFAIFAVAGCAHTDDEEQGGGDRVEAPSSENGDAAA